MGQTFSKAKGSCPVQSRRAAAVYRQWYCLQAAPKAVLESVMTMLHFEPTTSSCTFIVHFRAVSRIAPTNNSMPALRAVWNVKDGRPTCCCELCQIHIDSSSLADAVSIAELTRWGGRYTASALAVVSMGTNIAIAAMKSCPSSIHQGAKKQRPKRRTTEVLIGAPITPMSPRFRSYLPPSHLFLRGSLRSQDYW
jgi:hypothetical protein